jgi:hypothetical protein
VLFELAPIGAGAEGGGAVGVLPGQGTNGEMWAAGAEA